MDIQLNLLRKGQEDIFEELLHISRKQDIIMANLDKLAEAVARLDTVEASALAFVQGLQNQVADLTKQLELSATDQAKVDAFQADLAAKTDALAAAVGANTPAAPVTPAEPPAEPPAQ